MHRRKAELQRTAKGGTPTTRSRRSPHAGKGVLPLPRKQAFYEGFDAGFEVAEGEGGFGEGFEGREMGVDGGGVGEGEELLGEEFVLLGEGDHVGEGTARSGDCKGRKRRR